MFETKYFLDVFHPPSSALIRARRSTHVGPSRWERRRGVAACRHDAAPRREIRVQPPPTWSQAMVHVSNQALVLREISVQCSQNAHPFHPSARSVSTGPGRRQRPNSLIRSPQKTRDGRTSLIFGSRQAFELKRLARSRFPGNRQGFLHVGAIRANDGQDVTQLGDITNFAKTRGPMNSRKRGWNAFADIALRTIVPFWVIPATWHRG
ncbi:hypothetical protein BDP55DRAFT_223702 [Colletotrichum godetiae]|uniref:Uncharacterized protein n=1 Tax=Colletotrichum godetiae TaxID=1209918 RepID=A0AAJ0ER01_9PEZI|nr:uncharacterized protein BDP55DRAFT_223702 [Colletotrichum godetiae]KAK1673401.1 hypothetical protein BDP55DRAFT_223702 [Colletotrichum godetiae]